MKIVRPHHWMRAFRKIAVVGFGSGIGQAAQPIVSENYGTGKHNRYWKAENFGMKTAVLLGTLFTMICVAFPIEVTGVFMKMTPAKKSGSITVICGM